MKSYYTKTGIIIILLLVSVVFMGSFRPSNAQFVVAGWDYPDENGQGIWYMTVRENSTGSWGLVGIYYYDDETLIDWYLNASIKLHCFSRFNNTFMGMADTDEGKQYLRHSVIVTTPVLGTVFSQQNFTYAGVYTGEDPMWLYEYEVVLNFLPIAGAIYTAVVNYEVYW